MAISTINQYFSENQPLTVRLTVNVDAIDLIDATLKIKCINRETLSSVEYDADIYDSDNEVITANIPGGVLSEGIWSIQASITFDGDTYPTLGKPVYINIEG